MQNELITITLSILGTSLIPALATYILPPTVAKPIVSFITSKLYDYAETKFGLSNKVK